MKKRIWAALLIMLLLLQTVAPASVFADDEIPTDAALTDTQSALEPDALSKGEDTLEPAALSQEQAALTAASGQTVDTMSAIIPGVGKVYEVTFDGVVYLVHPGRGMDPLPDLPAGAAGWYDEEGNEITAPLKPKGDMTIHSRPREKEYSLLMSETAYAKVWGDPLDWENSWASMQDTSASDIDRLIEAKSIFGAPEGASLRVQLLRRAQLYTINPFGGILADWGVQDAGYTFMLELDSAAGYAVAEEEIIPPYSGITVSGNLPEGAQLKVVPLTAVRSTKALSAKGGSGSNTLFAVDISLTNCAELTEPVTVTLTDPDMVDAIIGHIKAGHNVMIRHDHNGEVEDLPIYVSGSDATGYSVSFATSSFSTFSGIWDDLIDLWNRIVYFTDRVITTVLSSGQVSLSLSGYMPRTAEVQAIDVTDSFGGNTLYAFDISLMNQNVEIQPVRGAIQVSVSSAGIQEAINEGRGISVYHISDSGVRTVVSGVSVSGNSVSWEADSFSIYVVDGPEAEKRLEYQFYVDDDMVATEIVRKALDLSSNTVVYDQLYAPHYVPEYGKALVGWSYSKNGTVNDALTIDALNADARDKLDHPETTFVDGATLVTEKVYAVFTNAYYLRYLKLDEYGNVIVLDTITKTDESEDKTVTIQSFGTETQYWVDAATGTSYSPGDQVQLNKQYDLYLKVEGSHWLVFNTQASGIDYVPPQLLTGDQTTHEPTEPKRKGYSFGGWYMDAACTPGNEFTFEQTLSQDTTVYAKWIPDVANYYINIWKQVATDEWDTPDAEKQYEFVETITVSAHTGDSVNIFSNGQNPTNKNENAYEGTSYYKTHYNANNSDTGNVEVASDGSTTLNVYYDLDQFTLTFKDNVLSYTPSTSDKSGYYYIPDGNGGYVRVYLYRNGGRWYRTRTGSGWGGYQYSNPYDGDVYTQSNNVETIHEIKALWGHDISGEWTFTGTNGVYYDEMDTSTSWQPSGSSTYTARIYSIPIMPAEDITFTPTSSNYTERMFYYYVEALPDETGTVRTFNGKRYVKKLEVKNDFNIVYYNDDFLEFDGFERQTIAKSNNDIVNISNNGTNWTAINNNYGGENNKLYFYYTRNKYPLVFKTLESGYIHSDEKREDVYFEQNLSDYGKDGSKYYVPPETVAGEGYIFDGWYEDAAYEKEFDFEHTNMPSHSVDVYSKWVPIRFRVVLVPTENNAQNDEVFFPNNQALSFRVNYWEAIDDQYINESAARRAGYKLAGWYTTPDFQPGTEWEFGQTLTRNAPGVNMDYQQSSEWMNNTWGDNDLAHNNVKGILKLYAKWEVDTDWDENRIYVEYEVENQYLVWDNAGNLLTTIPGDTNIYIDGNDNVVYIKEAPGNTAQGYTFTDWVVLNSNGTKSSINSAERTSFTIDNSLIRTSEVSYVDDLGVTQTKMIKYITLQAEFTFSETEATIITFNANRHENDDSITKTLLLNETTVTLPAADSFTWEGHILKGWAFDSNLSYSGFEAARQAGNAFTPETTVAVDNRTLSELNTNANTLYAVWEPKTYTVTVKKQVNAANTSGSFQFTVSKQDGTVQPYNLQPSEMSFSLTHEDTQIFTNVPYGTQLAFSETKQSNFALESVTILQITDEDHNPGSSQSLGNADNTPFTVKGDVEIVYTNTPCIDVTVTKQITGNMGDWSESFPFSVSLSRGQFIDDAGQKVNTIEGISLGNGESVTLHLDPSAAGATLTITETDLKGYTLTVAGGTINGTGNGCTLTVPSAGSSTSVTFTNTKDISVDTGLTLETAPYLMLLMLSALGAVLSFRKNLRRRREE